MQKRIKVGFVSLGCAKNLVDTENMMSTLSRDGFVVTGDQREANVIVINTCGFLNPAKKESMETIDEYAKLKDQGQLKSLIVAGCMTERYLDEMKSAFPQVDDFIRTGEFSRISQSVAQSTSEQQAIRQNLVGETPQLEGHSEISDYVQRLGGSRSYAYVKISEGCNRKCSFCIIPKLRGKHHSRSIAGIVDEIEQLTDTGVPEINFIAQDLTSYGKDLRNGTSLLKLLQAVEGIDNLYQYRLLYNYPRFFTDELIDFLAQSQKFSGYLDIPFQHASNNVLKSMNRPESAEDIRKLITKLRNHLPRVALRTTLMVGFPGETEQDFEELVEFIKLARFQNMGAFKFYREANTPSYDLPHQVPQELKDERYDRLMQVQQQIQKELLEEQIGSSTELVIDECVQEKRGVFIHRARNWTQAPEIDGVTYLEAPEELSAGEVVAAEVTATYADYDLKARAILADELQELHAL